jgi:hypothetical protein
VQRANCLYVSRAGYSAKTTQVQGSRLLSIVMVQEVLAETMQERSEQEKASGLVEFERVNRAQAPLQPRGRGRPPLRDTLTGGRPPGRKVPDPYLGGH